MTSQTPDISIVIPLFNEDEGIEQLVDDLQKVLNMPYELVLVDDGSDDNTWQIVCKLAALWGEVKGICLSRNFGHQTALIAGMEHASASRVITMDGDGQHPPSLIPVLLQKMDETGCDVVNTIRRSGSDVGYFKNRTSRGYYTLINRLSDTPVKPGAADFRLMNKKASKAFLSFQESTRFNRGLVGWMGFHQEFVEFDAPPRQSGATKYTRRKMFRFALDGITSFSTRPIRLAFYLGLTTVFLGVLYGGYVLYQHTQDQTVPGWTSTILVVLFTAGVNLIMLGIIGEYVGRILMEVKHRPRYFVSAYTHRQDEHN